MLLNIAIFSKSEVDFSSCKKLHICLHLYLFENVQRKIKKCGISLNIDSKKYSITPLLHFSIEVTEKV